MVVLAVEEKNITVDSEFHSLLPPLDLVELSELEKSIIEEGVREPLIIWKETGKIIDGHNRFSICSRNNIPFTCQEISFQDRSAVILWIIKNQIGRRNLNPYQRSQLALKLKPVIQQQAKEKQVSTLKQNETTVRQNSAQREEESIKTRNELAKIAQVSHDTIAKVEKIETSPERDVKQAARTGTLSVNAAHQEVVNREEGNKIFDSKAVESCVHTNPIDIDHLISLCENLISYIIRRRGWESQRDDLMQEGRMAVMELAQKNSFDPSRGSSIYSYFYVSIQNSIIDYLKRDGRSGRAIAAKMAQPQQDESGNEFTPQVPLPTGIPETHRFAVQSIMTGQQVKDIIDGLIHQFENIETDRARLIYYWALLYCRKELKDCAPAILKVSKMRQLFKKAYQWHPLSYLIDYMTDEHFREFSVMFQGIILRVPDIERLEKRLAGTSL